MAQMVVFDYGRTLYDRESDGFFPGAVSTVRSLAARYRLGGDLTQTLNSH